MKYIHRAFRGGPEEGREERMVQAGEDAVLGSGEAPVVRGRRAMSSKRRAGLGTGCITAGALACSLSLVLWKHLAGLHGLKVAFKRSLV